MLVVSRSLSGPLLGRAEALHYELIAEVARPPGPVGGVSRRSGRMTDNPDCRASSIEVKNLSHRTHPRFTESLRLITGIIILSV